MKAFRILYAPHYNAPRRDDLVIEAETRLMARFAFSELYPYMQFKRAIPQVMGGREGRPYKTF